MSEIENKSKHGHWAKRKVLCGGQKILRKEMELIALLGDDKLKNIGEQLAEIVRQHNLQKSPDVCRKLFDYFSEVITGWNCV